MRIITTITALAIVLTGSIAPAFATSQFRQLRVETPSWVNEIRNKDLPDTPALVAKNVKPLPLAEVGTSDDALLAPPPICPETPVVDYSATPEPARRTGVAEAAPLEEVTIPEPGWVQSTPKIDVGTSYVAKDPKQFNYRVNFQYIGADGSPLAPVPEPSSIIGLAAPLLGSLVYWRRRRAA